MPSTEAPKHTEKSRSDIILRIGGVAVPLRNYLEGIMVISTLDFNVNSNSKFFNEETNITTLEGRDFWRAFIDTDEIAKSNS